MMDKEIMKLTFNMKKQFDEYIKVEEIENTKSKYITDQNGKKIQELSENQEKILKKINELNSERIQIIKEFIKNNNLNNIKSDLTLKEIINFVDEDSSSSIYEAGVQLKEVVLRIKSINSRNAMLLKDNLEYYNILMENIKQVNSKSEGYSSNGEHKTERENGALIFNKTV